MYANEVDLGVVHDRRECSKSVQEQCPFSTFANFDPNSSRCFCSNEFSFSREDMDQYESCFIPTYGIRK